MNIIMIKRLICWLVGHKEPSKVEHELIKSREQRLNKKRKELRKSIPKSLKISWYTKVYNWFLTEF